MVLNTPARRRAASGLAAVVAALGLVALGPVDPARAAGSAVDQITGNGVTDTAVTVRWDAGLVGQDNQTVVKPRDPNSPYAFMYDDFKNLEVTVGQTKNLVHQAIQVTWKGGIETTGQGQFVAHYLQFMECYGDTTAGPDPESCQFGATGLKIANSGGTNTAMRAGTTCESHTPSVTDPPMTREGQPALLGCDPAENPDAPGYTHQYPGGGKGTYTVPFIPADTGEKIFDPALFPFNKFNSNEIQQATTRPDGTGEVYFNTLTRREAPGLGCGEIQTNGKPRDCWLVIVPRGGYEPNGWKLSGDGISATMQESPLGSSTWAQRIQVRLGYSPVEPNCPIGSAKERQTQGTELVSHAVYSWQLALNNAANCHTLYGYAATPEASNTAELSNSMSETGLTFTTVPIGNEAIRGGSTPPALPPLVYAPVAVSAVTFGFHVNLLNGYVSTPVKLTPRLVAKALTQSYRSDLTDLPSFGSTGPEWARQNPMFMTQDPEFIKVNPGIGQRSGSSLMAPLLTAEHSGIIKQVWAWVLTDSSARAWLGGAKDENNMVVNPKYQELGLNNAPLDSFPRPNQCYNTGVQGERDPGRCTLDLLPYTENFDESAARVRQANNPEGADWDITARAPDGSAGWWSVPFPIQFPGQVFMWGVMDSASLANYGVIPAQLCKSDGTGCVSPTEATVAAAVSAARPDSSGLLQVDPASPGAGAYPLTAVTYAAVRKNQEQAALADYAALIKFAVNEGQTPGVDPGNLPHGYLPLPQNLRDTATAVANLLINPTTTTTTTTTTAGTGSGNNGGGGGGGGSSGVPNTGARPSASTSSAPPFTTTTASPVPAAMTTPPQAVGVIRWALLVVIIAGLAGSVGGPLLRFALSRRTPP
ncbi:MAG TPA: hypothetical protein VL738_10795 [Dactylosporangium sp.]|nr:hypothetical protein [Dactylosporangium sp.]